MGLDVYDLNGEYIEFKMYNTYNDLVATNEMTTYINSLPTGYKVLVGIKGEGSYELHPPAYAAL